MKTDTNRYALLLAGLATLAMASAGCEIIVDFNRALIDAGADVTLLADTGTSADGSVDGGPDTGASGDATSDGHVDSTVSTDAGAVVGTDAHVADAHVADSHVEDSHVADSHVADAHVADAGHSDAPSDAASDASKG